jgi:hypothetical protein
VGGQIVVGSFIGTAIGGLITLIVAHWYYRESAVSLHFEAKAGHLSHDIVELLVAFHDWGQEMREAQAIALKSKESNGPTYYFRHVRSKLREAGLAHDTLHAFGVSEGSKTPPPASYRSLSLTNEGKELAAYLRKTRCIDARVVQVFHTGPDGKYLVRLVWTCMPGEKPGPVGETKVSDSADDEATVAGEKCQAPES